MKKTIYISLGLAALTFASCSQDAEPAFGAEEASVTITVNGPEDFTRAADGLTVDQLQYAVYEISDGQLNIYEEVTLDSEVSFPLNLNLQLITGRDYGILMWASNSKSPYTVDFRNGSLTVEYTEALANSETLDAFYSYNTLSLDGNTQINVTMKRPFAMVNIGANPAPEYGWESSVTVAGVASGLNLITGELAETTESAIFGYAAVPELTYPVTGYGTLAYAYVIAPAQAAQYTITYSYTTPDSDTPVSATVENVSLQANYRTNIYGSLPAAETTE